MTAQLNLSTEQDDDGMAASQPRPSNAPQPSPTAQPTAKPVQASPRPASAEEKQTMRERAAAVDLTPTEFANVILRATGAEPRTWPTDEAAEQTLGRLIDHLAAQAVDRVLAGIAAKAGA
jgi:hypothetical protein